MTGCNSTGASDYFPLDLGGGDFGLKPQKNWNVNWIMQDQARDLGIGNAQSFDV